MDYHNYPQKVIIKGQRKWIRTEGRRDGLSGIPAKAVRWD